jgi:hypothetical protein
MDFVLCGILDPSFPRRRESMDVDGGQVDRRSNADLLLYKD